MHIDDPRSPHIRLPSLSSCLDLKPSQIIEKLIRTRKPEGAGGDGQEIDDDDMPALEDEDAQVCVYIRVAAIIGTASATQYICLICNCIDRNGKTTFLQSILL